MKFPKKFLRPLLAGALLAAAVPWHGCAFWGAAETVTPYLSSTYERDTSVRASRFKMVDNFASRDFKNQIGGGWTSRASERSSVLLDYAEEEAAMNYGFALAVKYRLVADGQAAVSTDLNGLDISRGEALTFWLSYSAQQNAKIRLRLLSDKSLPKEIDLSGRLNEASKNWQEVYVPFREMAGVNFNRVEKLEILIESENGDEGAFFVDHIGFFGPEQVFFESLKDNLRGFPKEMAVDRRELLALDDRALLHRISRDTWAYFENMIDRRHRLPLDRVKLSWRMEIGDYTSPTDIGLYYVACIAAAEMRYISKPEAAKRISRSLDTVRKLPKWKGFLYNYYSTTNLHPTSFFVSSVDNGWFAACLMVAKAYFPETLGPRVDGILKEMDFGELYDFGIGKFNLGYDDAAKKYTSSHYGLLVSEARIASVVAIAKGDVEPEHWYLLQRTPPRSERWQNQLPQGRVKTMRDINFFGGYYRYGKKKIVPSWGGSLFEFLMPTLLIDEFRLAPEGLGLNGRKAAEIHRDYALLKKRYPVWGISPCMVDRGARGNFLELGIREIAVKGYADKAIVSPHASFLALELITESVLTNIRRLLTFYDIYGPYGFYDAVYLRGPKVTRQYLALDQAMIFIAVTNYLKNGMIRQLFHRLPESGKINSLLGEEKFFKN
ncbi:MAG: DUF3131 domain-containing protein [Candidatus Omnitrophica bacterium]|nr:DUF3131 domain-containing protein [Candidatus Omnitrophota bacterium]